MRLERLTLKGFLRFREPLTLDLTELAPGLVAIVGENGSGKTTLLEAPLAALYRSFVSRGELLDYATDGDSFLEVQIATDGAGTFRARVNVDGAHRKTDATLEQLQADGGRALLNDGKVSTYDAAVRQHFPDRDLLLASSFAAQNKAGSFITLDKKSRKALFLQLLGLERYQQMSDTARQAASLVDQSRARLDAQRALLARDVSGAVGDELAARARTLADDHEAALTRQGNLKVTIAQRETELALVADQAAAYAAAQLTVSRVEQDLAATRTEAQATARVLLSVKADGELELDRIRRQRVTDVAAIEQVIANNETLRSNAAAVGEAVVSVRACEGELARLRDEERSARATFEELAEAADELRRRQTAAQSTRFKLDAAETDAKTLHTVPCAGQGAYASCKFLERATAAEHTLPQLRQDLEAVATIQQAIADNVRDRGTAKAKLMGAEGKIAAVEDRLRRDRVTAALAEKLAVAEARIEELRARATEVLTRAQADTRAAQLRLETRVLELTTTGQALDLRIDGLVLEHEQAVDALAGAAEGNRAAVVAQQRVAEARAEWDHTTATIARLDAELRDVLRRQRELEQRREQVMRLEGQLRTLETDLHEWQTLAQAFGRDGLPVLEIDAAGPTISNYTNELLATCYGPRFTVDVVTQEAKAGGKGLKETFTIAVLDNAAGGAARDIADLSGGEQVIVAEALANAIAIYVNTRSPQPVRTCWRDETTGALDPENAQRYLAMLRKVQQLGGFHHVLFVTHNLDAAAQADAQIRLGGGRLALVQPPFTEAA